MIKAHEFARQLLAGTDRTLVIPVMLDYAGDSTGQGAILADPLISHIEGYNNSTGQEEKMLCLTHPPYVEEVGISDPTPQGLRERAKLVHEVLNKAFDESDGWSEDDLGTVMAYLVLAILDGKPDSFVTWPLDDGSIRFRNARTRFESWFPHDHAVWKYIQSGDPAVPA